MVRLHAIPLECSRRRRPPHREERLMPRAPVFSSIGKLDRWFFDDFCLKLPHNFKALKIIPNFAYKVFSTQFQGMWSRNLKKVLLKSHSNNKSLLIPIPATSHKKNVSNQPTRWMTACCFRVWFSHVTRWLWWTPVFIGHFCWLPPNAAFCVLQSSSVRRGIHL